MKEISDGIAQLVFMVGGDNNDIYIDNVSLKVDVSTNIKKSNDVIREFKLYNNYPNPFNPTTEIKFSIPIQGIYSLKIYNVLGEEIRNLINGHLNTGDHTVTFDAANLSSGIYFYTLTGNKINISKKMLLIK